MIEFDHIAISGETLDAAQAHVEDALGVALQAGGAHDVFFTHNALLGLEDGLYLEAIAINPDAPRPERPRWFDLDRFSGGPRLTNWICRTQDLGASLQLLPDDMGAPVELQRGDLRWRMAVPQSGILPFDNCAPALIEWQTKTHPATRLKSSGVTLRRLTISHPAGQVLADMLSPLWCDDRVEIEEGEMGLNAVFDTPHGRRQISG